MKKVILAAAIILTGVVTTNVNANKVVKVTNTTFEKNVTATAD